MPELAVLAVADSEPGRSTTVLPEARWHELRDSHMARVRRWTEPHQRRRDRGERHPVLDFLFTYYSHRPARFARWNPAPDVVLAGESAREYLDYPGYVETADGVTLDRAAFTATRRRTARFVLDLLVATASRAPKLGCFGLHEWAMVYRQTSADRRHADWPLRLGADGTDAVIESMPVRCGHYDAFRFFTEQARPLNALRPTRDTQTELEQPGCLHTNMDLFKWAYKLDPFTPSDLVADCFELAVEIRELDMRASPYDLRSLGYQPVPIETQHGRAQYVREQTAFAARAAPLRQRLIDLCRQLLSW